MKSLHFYWDLPCFHGDNKSQNQSSILQMDKLNMLDSMEDLNSCDNGTISQHYSFESEDYSKNENQQFCISDTNLKGISITQPPLYPIHTPITYPTVYLKIMSYDTFRGVMNHCLTSFTQQLFFILRVLQGNEMLMELFHSSKDESNLLLLQKAVHTVYRDWRLLLDFSPHKKLLKSSLLDFIRQCTKLSEPADEDSFSSLSTEIDEPSRLEYLSEEEKILITTQTRKDFEIGFDLFWPSSCEYIEKDGETRYLDFYSIPCLHKVELSTLCLWMGWLCTSDDELEKANCWYNAAVRVVENSRIAPNGPQNMFLYYSRARLWNENYLLIREYEKALKFLKYCPLPLNNYAIAYTKIGRPHKALECYNYSLELDPNYVLSLNNRASLWGNELRNPSKAEQDFEIAISLGDDLSTTYLYRASMFKNVHKDYRRSIEDYTRCLSLTHSDFEEVYCDRADAYCNNLEFSKALKDYEACLAINPGNLEALYGRGRLYSELLNEPNQALLDYTHCIEECFKQNASHITTSAAFNNRGVLYHDKFKDTAKAMRDFQIAVQLHPESIYAIQNLRDLQVRISQTWAIGNI